MAKTDKQGKAPAKAKPSKSAKDPLAAFDINDPKSPKRLPTRH